MSCKGYLSYNDPFTRNLRQVMYEHGTNIKGLARDSGITDKCLYEYANGRIHPRLDKLRQIKRALNCTWDELLGE